MSKISKSKILKSHYDKIEIILNLLRRGEYEKSLKIMENIGNGDNLMEIVLLKGEAYFNMKDYKNAHRNYTKYVIARSYEMVENGGFEAGGEDECVVSAFGRKNSRCIYELEGLKAARKYLLLLYDLYKHPVILGQLAVFLRESGHIQSAEYYEERERVLQEDLYDS